jgi:hypothetical protein
VTQLQERFPILDRWRFDSAELVWDKSAISFRNTRKVSGDEFSGARVKRWSPRHFGGIDLPGDDPTLMPLQESIHHVAGGHSGNWHLVSPIGGCFISEFAFHYLGLFLLSSLVRYRPEAWTHAISHSATRDLPPDDQALSLIAQFLELNSSTIPNMVVEVLNPHEDQFFRINTTESL